MLAFAHPSLASVLLVAYVAVGGGVAWRLHREEPSWVVLTGALVAWPVFLPLLGGGGSASGPLGARIAQEFDALTRTLADPSVEDVPWAVDLSALRLALERSDERLALVDRLIAQSPPGTAGDLVSARDRSAAELGGVLDEVVQLRLQIGLAALAGDRGAVRARLTALLDRAAALDEVTRFHG